MFNIKQAILIVKKNFPDGKIQKYVAYKNLYVFQIFTDDPFEGEMDPFYSVNRSTGEFLEFSVLDKKIMNDIFPLFKLAKVYSP